MIDSAWPLKNCLRTQQGSKSKSFRPYPPSAMPYILWQQEGPGLNRQIPRPKAISIFKNLNSRKRSGKSDITMQSILTLVTQSGHYRGRTMLEREKEVGKIFFKDESGHKYSRVTCGLSFPFGNRPGCVIVLYEDLNPPRICAGIGLLNCISQVF